MNINYILTVHGIINSSKTIDQLSFRQRVDENYNVSYHLHDFLYIGHLYKQWYYIEQGDYNTYFVDGQVKEKYSDLRK